MKHIIRFCKICGLLCLGGLLYFDSVYQSTLTRKPDLESGHVLLFNHRYYTSEQMETLRDFVFGGLAFCVLGGYLQHREERLGRA